MAKLTGYKLPTLKGAADHTYVACSGGHAWGCWGRSSGGKSICAGDGSSARANCLSKPKSTAGIVYALTGVCHQAANRILMPARVTVHKAKGYWASSLFYGTYGKGAAEWLARIAVCSVYSGEIDQCTSAVSASGASSEELPEEDSSERALVTQIQALYEDVPDSQRVRMLSASETAPDLLGEELRLTVRHRLGEGFSDSGIGELQEVQQETLADAQKLERSFHEQALVGSALAERLNQAINEGLEKCAKSLGKDKYRTYFELEPGDRIDIVMPDLAELELE